MHSIRAILVTSALAAGAVFSAPAQHDPAAEARARLIGALDLTIVSAELDAVPARDAIRMLAAAAGVHIQGRYADDPAGYGIDPSVPIAFAIQEVPARQVLEMILDQAAIDEPITWQLRRGFVEVGTKERLSGPGAAEQRLYPIRELLIEAPYFASGAGFTRPGRQFADHPYAAAAVTRPSPDRKTPQELVLEIVEAIVETVEPGNWDYGQMPEEDAYFINDDPDAPAWGASGADRPRRIPKKIARLRVSGDKLVIVAPDFIHRQVAGYPAPLPPPLLTDEERARRQVKATAAGGRITVVQVGTPRRRGPP